MPLVENSQVSPQRTIVNVLEKAESYIKSQTALRRYISNYLALFLIQFAVVVLLFCLGYDYHAIFFMLFLGGCIFFFAFSSLSEKSFSPSTFAESYPDHVNSTADKHPPSDQ